MTDEIIEQIKIVRDTGKTNMFDTRNVALIALWHDCYDLAEYLSDPRNTKEYCNFIIHGKRAIM